MKTQGIILKTDGEFVIVGIKRHSACDTCRAECGGHCDKASVVEARVKNTLKAKPGDTVEIYSKTSAVILASFLVFILPMIMAIAGYLIPMMLNAKATFSALLSLIFFLSTFFVLWKIWGKKDKFTDIEMIRIIGDRND